MYLITYNDGYGRVDIATKIAFINEELAKEYCATKNPPDRRGPYLDYKKIEVKNEV